MAGDDVQKAMVAAGRQSSRSFPDAGWINKEISIVEVARALGLQGDGRVFDCFRDHPYGKPKRSLSVHAAANKARCFVCDKRSMSNIDLVMNVRGCDVGPAIKWFGTYFKNIPTVELRPKRRRMTYAQSRRRPMTLENLVTSAGWTALSPAAKLVLTAIFARTPAMGSERGCLHCTYALIMRWTGLRSRATIAAALQELRNAKSIQTERVPTNHRTRRGFWLKELLVRVSPRAMRVPRDTRRTATSYSVQKMNSQYPVQKMNSGPEILTDWRPPEGTGVQ
jgi:hypothetical protein